MGVPEGPWKPEFRFRRSRLDFGIPGPWAARPRALLEVKSANLRVGPIALFPDAPTARGTRHVQELTAAARAGTVAAVLFVVQRGDVRGVGPYRRMDPEFGRACDQALRNGVTFSAVRLRVRPEGASLGGRLPVVGLSTLQQIGK